jgi:hypothetical protein
MLAKYFSIFLILGGLGFFSPPEPAELILNINQGGKSIEIDSSKLSVLLLLEKGEIPLSEHGDLLTIPFFSDSARIAIRYKNHRIETGSFSFASLSTLSEIKVNILTRRQIRRSKLYGRNTLAVYEINELPKGHGVGRTTICIVEKMSQ